MKKIIALACIAVLFGCSYFAQTFTKKKQASATETQLSKEANRFFWNNFHQGNYDKITSMLTYLFLAQRDNPNDFKISEHLAFTYIWKLSERQRMEMQTPLSGADILLAKRYFEEAYQLNPHDPRVLGFLADMKLTEGTVMNNQKLVVEGYFQGKKSIRMWPQFNKFTIGYVSSQLDINDRQFKKGLQQQWETLDDCACKKLDYTDENNFKAMATLIEQSSDAKIKRACWNSWIAPHNFEGFFYELW